MSITPLHTGYLEMAEMFREQVLQALPKGTPMDLKVNVLLNATTAVIEQATSTSRATATQVRDMQQKRAEALALSIDFLIGEARRLGVNLDDLGRYCQQLATDNDKVFYDARRD